MSMYATHSFDADVMLSIPPKVDADGLGIFAAGTSPLVNLRQSLPVVPAVQFAGVYPSPVVTCDDEMEPL